MRHVLRSLIYLCVCVCAGKANIRGHGLLLDGPLGTSGEVGVGDVAVSALHRAELPCHAGGSKETHHVRQLPEEPLGDR